jgi:transcriptional antiterminator RfaH
MTSLNHEYDWFLAQLKPNCGQIAKRNLERQGFQTFFPRQEETTRCKRKFSTKLRPLFPGYIFVSFDVTQGGWRTVNSTYGITQLVSFDNEPTTVPRDIIVSLMQRCDADAKLLPPPTLMAGDNVQLTSGPFADFMATVEKEAPDKRVWVLLELMGRQTRIMVGEDGLRLT